VDRDAKRARARPHRLAAAGAGGRDIVIVGTHAFSRLYLRFHVALLILWSFGCGLLVNKALMLAGVDAMLVRYPVSLMVGYGAFFVGVRLWLAYVGAAPLFDARKSAARDSGNSGIDLSDAGSWRGSGSGPGVRGGGGDFGGGGASASFGDGPAEATASAPRMSISRPAFLSSGSGSSASGGSGSGGGSIDFDLGDGDGWLVILLLALAAALLCSVFGAVLYVVYSAPSMLADVAFSAMLAGGLVKSSRRWRDACWETRLLSATWIPFAIVLVLALATAGLALHLFPEARTLSDVIRTAITHLG
jgi:hypothetical protein